jgi:hypothetical protein
MFGARYLDADERETLIATSSSFARRRCDEFLA